MSGSKILPAILIMVLATVLLSPQASSSEPAAAVCKANPGANTPRGAHWYFRINHARQHCWYLGQAGAHVNASADAAEPAPVSTPPRRGGGADALSTTPPAASAMASSAVSPISPAPTAFAPMASAPDAVAAAPPDAGQQAGFVTRWPDDLPNADDADQQEPAMRSSYADAPEATAAAAQMPSSWPLAAAAEGSAGQTAFRYFSVAGMVAIALLLVAGWAAKFARRRQGFSVRAQGRAIVERLRLRPVDVVPMAAARSAPAIRRRAPERGTRTPTDPAHDLKASLAELMRDLRRAGAFELEGQAEHPRHQTKTDAYYAALEAAE
jgi:hypothetical protein